MSENTRRELERVDEYRAEQIAREAQKRLARLEHIVNGLGEVKGEIVRCKSCKNYNGQDSKIGTCDLGVENSGLVSIVEPDGFCAWGERRRA